MKVLLDESVPKALGFELHGHFVRTVQTLGWSGFSNGRLLDAMARQGFEVLVTCDQNIDYQQHPALPVALIILLGRDNRVPTVLRFAPAVLAALKSICKPQVLRLSDPGQHLALK